MDRVAPIVEGLVDHGSVLGAAPLEQQLSANGRFAMAEATRYFEGKGSVHETVERISRRLDELGTPFVVVDGVAMFHHGFRRFTEDVDLLVVPLTCP